MAKKYKRDMPLPSSNDLFGGPGKGGPGKSPSSMFAAPKMPVQKATVTSSSSKKDRRQATKDYGAQMKALNERKRNLGKATTRGPGLSGDKLKAERAKINSQMADIRKKRSSLTTTGEVVKSKVKRATENMRASTKRGGSCSKAQAKGGSCSAGRNKTLGGKF
jgi:hypothetical protein